MPSLLFPLHAGRHKGEEGCGGVGVMVGFALSTSQPSGGGSCTPRRTAPPSSFPFLPPLCTTIFPFLSTVLPPPFPFFFLPPVLQLRLPQFSYSCISFHTLVFLFLPFFSSFYYLFLSFRLIIDLLFFSHLRLLRTLSHLTPFFFFLLLPSCIFLSFKLSIVRFPTPAHPSNPQSCYSFILLLPPACCSSFPSSLTFTFYSYFFSHSFSHYSCSIFLSFLSSFLPVFLPSFRYTALSLFPSIHPSPFFSYSFFLFSSLPPFFRPPFLVFAFFFLPRSCALRPFALFS